MFSTKAREILEIEHQEIELDQTLEELKQALIEKHSLPNEVLLFVEDVDDELDSGKEASLHSSKHGLKVHIHRCRKVQVEVNYNGQTVERRFGPGTTIARVKRWAAEREFGMSPDEAGEHVLQITGTDDRPEPGRHLGTLVAYPDCHISFDLVPDERIQGALK